MGRITRQEYEIRSTKCEINSNVQNLKTETRNHDRSGLAPKQIRQSRFAHLNYERSAGNATAQSQHGNSPGEGSPPAPIANLRRTDFSPFMEPPENDPTAPPGLGPVNLHSSLRFSLSDRPVLTRRSGLHIRPAVHTSGGTFRMTLASSGRRWPAPCRPWNMSMTWHDLLFAHWPVPASDLRPMIPAPLELDTYERDAWIGVVPFGMSNVRHRLLPELPGTSRFPELNVRTYVTIDGKPGVWFFSLDAANRLAVWIARRTFHLPYLNARMSLQVSRTAVSFSCERTHRGVPGALFRGHYQPTGPVYRTKEGDLDHWLTARYCLYAADRQRRVWRGEIDHEPWPLQVATADIQSNSMVNSLGIALGGHAQVLHFVRHLDVVAWTLEPVTK